MAEALPGFDIASWNDFLAPKGTSKEICDRLVLEMQAVLKDPAVIGRFEELGAGGNAVERGASAGEIGRRDRQVQDDH